MKQKYHTKIMEAIHEEAEALFEAGAIDENRMAEYDKACLLSKPGKNSSTVNPAPLTRGRQPPAPVYARQH